MILNFVTDPEIQTRETANTNTFYAVKVVTYLEEVKLSL